MGAIVDAEYDVTWEAQDDSDSPDERDRIKEPKRLLKTVLVDQYQTTATNFSNLNDAQKARFRAALRMPANAVVDQNSISAALGYCSSKADY